MKYLLILILCLLYIPAHAIDETWARAMWNPPAYGTPVVRYTMQLSMDSGDWYTVSDSIYDEYYDFECDFFTHYRARVAGIDAENRQGPYSLPTNNYSPSEVFPWKPNKPTITIQ